MHKTYRLARAGIRRALGLHTPGRNLEVFEDDIFLVSYPKSGNTWTRFLIANLLYPDRPADFANINELTPDPEALSVRQLAKIQRPRIIKSHQYFDPRYTRIICIVRDPRDVVLSQLHFQRKRMLISDDFPIEQFVAGFIGGKTSNYGSWGENIGSWLITRGNGPNFLLLRYEDLLESTTMELAKVAEFLHINASAERLTTAAERSSADSMRKLERVGASQWSSTKATRQDIPFVRAARSGGWRTELPENCVAQIEAAWGHLMQYLNYPLVSDAGAGCDPALAALVGRGPGSL
jgi:hypothetical protein